MPLFDFKCENCQMTMERLVKSAESEAPVCSKCGGETHKLISKASLEFKGPGFYCVDYRIKK